VKKRLIFWLIVFNAALALLPAMSSLSHQSRLTILPSGIHATAVKH
jgi:hypothetical protein